MRGEAPLLLSDLAGKIGHAAREIGDLSSIAPAIARPHRRQMIDHEDREGRQGNDGGFRARQPEGNARSNSDRAGDQHHSKRNDELGQSWHRRPSPQPA